MRRWLPLLILVLAAPALAMPPSFHDGRQPWLSRPPLRATFSPALVGTPSPASGNLRLLVVLMQYADRAADPDRSDDADYFRDMFFGADTTGQGSYPFDSMAAFYARQSGGALLLEGDVIGWSDAAHPQEWYATRNGSSSDGCHGLGNTSSGMTLFGALRGGARAIVAEALAAATAEVDLDDYDGNGDGILDGVIVVHAGPGGEMTGECEDLWSHQLEDTFALDLDGDGVAAADEERVVRYLVGPERFFNPLADPPSETPAGIGTFAHEFGHVLGLPDLYALSGQGYGVGHFSVMGWGLLRLQGVSETAFGADIAPTAFDPFSAQELGWREPQRVEGNLCGGQLYAIGTSDQTLRIDLDDRDRSEYYLVEYVRAEGDWQNYGGDGVAIWHVDEAKADVDVAINKEACAPLESIAACSDEHYWVSFEQADGDFDLELGNNLGETADLLASGDAFDRDGVPSSCSWDATDCDAAIGVDTMDGVVARLRVVVDPDLLPDEPQLRNLPDTRATVGVEYRYAPGLLAGDDGVSWALAGAPEGMAIDGATGAVTWTPANPGLYELTIFASNCAGEAHLTWTVAVHRAEGDGEGGCGCTVGGGARLDVLPGWLLMMLLALVAARRAARPD